MKRKFVDLSIIICNYNTRRFLEKNLAALKKALKNISSEIIVVDNGSTDGSASLVSSQFPSVRLIRNSQNLGYSQGYNQGTKIASGRYILHLNSDIEWSSGSDLKNLISFLDNNPRIGIAGCKIITSGGRLDLPCKRSLPTLTNVLFQFSGLYRIFPGNKLLGEYYLTYLDENKAQYVDCLMGAFMLIRKSVFDQIGLLDERFFIYGEDIDFCFRAVRAGWKIYYYPSLTVLHSHGGTTNKSKLKHLYLFHKAMYHYYHKHLTQQSPFLLNLLVDLAIATRFAICLSYELAKSIYRS